MKKVNQITINNYVDFYWEGLQISCNNWERMNKNSAYISDGYFSYINRIVDNDTGEIIKEVKYHLKAKILKSYNTICAAIIYTSDSNPICINFLYKVFNFECAEFTPNTSNSHIAKFRKMFNVNQDNYFVWKEVK